MNTLILKKHTVLYVFVSFFFVTSVQSQVGELDSLNSALDVVTNNKEKLSILLDIASINKDSLRDSAEGYLYYEKARILAIKEKDTAVIRKAIYHLGEILLEMEEYDMAITYFDTVKKSLLKKNEPSELLSLVYKNLGETYLRRGDYIGAGGFFDKGISYAETIGNTYQKGLNHLYKSELYYTQGDYDASEWQLSRAFSFFEKGKEPVMAHYFKGKLLYKKGDYQNAITSFTKTVTLAESENNITLKSKTLQLLADVYLVSGDEKMSLDYSKNALVIVDSLNDLNKRIALERIGYIHAFESVMEKNKEKESKKSEEARKEKEKRMLMYGIFVIVGVLLLGLFLYRQNKVMRMVKEMRKAQMDLVEKKQQEYL